MAEKKKPGLHKGLGNIFGAEGLDKVIDEIERNAIASSNGVRTEIPINEIRPNPYQPRKEFDKEALQELSETIKTHGIFNPLLVRKSIHGYDLVAGERRLRAAKIAGLETVPAIEVEFTDEMMMEISILENVQREDLNPIEEAQAYDSLIRKLGYTQEQLANRVGKSREYCANILRLLKLPEDVQEMVVKKQLSMGHVRALLSIKDDNEIYEAAEYAIKNRLTVREVEDYVRNLLGNTKKKPTRTIVHKDPWVKDLEERLQRKLGTEVNLSKKALAISYTDTDDLNRILEILGCLEESEEM